MISKSMKRIVTLVLILSLTIIQIPEFNNVIRVEAANHSQSEAVAWAKSQLGKGLDYDGVYGNQCVDLIAYYYQYLGMKTPGGNAEAYRYNTLPSGWSRVYGNPQVGDIAVWIPDYAYGNYITGSAGHVGIVTGVNGSTITVVNQNFASQSYCTSNNFPTTVIDCYIRPNWSNATPDITNQTPNLYCEGGAIKVVFQPVSNTQYYDIVWCGTDGVAMDYQNIGTNTSGTINVTSEGTYYVYVNAYGTNGNYTSSNRGIICIQGDRLNVDSVVSSPTMIKSNSGHYLYANCEKGVLEKKTSIDYSHLDNYYFILERVSNENDYILRSYVDGTVVTYSGGNNCKNLLHFNLKNYDVNDRNKIAIKARRGTTSYILFIAGSTYFVLDTGNTENDNVHSYLYCNVNNNYQKFDFVKLDLDVNGYVGKYDGAWHSISVGNNNAEVKYRTSTTEEWSTTKPTFKEPGLYTVYYSVTDPRYYVKTGSVQVIISKPDQGTEQVTTREQTTTTGTITTTRPTITENVKTSEQTTKDNSTIKNINIGTAKKPAKASIKTLKNKKKKKIFIRWKWQVEADGYQVQYALNKKFTKKLKTKNVNSFYKETLTIKNLKKKKTYYVRVRAYKITSETKKYGAWSKIKKVKIKK